MGQISFLDMQHRNVTLWYKYFKIRSWTTKYPSSSTLTSSLYHHQQNYHHYYLYENFAVLLTRILELINFSYKALFCLSTQNESNLIHSVDFKCLSVCFFASCSLFFLKQPKITAFNLMVMLSIVTSLNFPWRLTRHWTLTVAYIHELFYSNHNHLIKILMNLFI